MPSSQHAQNTSTDELVLESGWAMLWGFAEEIG